MKTIKILWVDDKFLDPDASFTKRVKEDIVECQDIENTIDVDMVSNREDFLTKLSSPDRTKYVAIILDAETADNINDSPDINTFNLHMRPIDNLGYKTMKYVYSSYPEQVRKMALDYGFEVKDKADIEPYDLLVEIKGRIQTEFPIVPEIMMAVREGFITSKENEKHMIDIIKAYHDPNSVPLESMRYILENIFLHLKDMYLFNLKALSSNKLSDYVDYLINGGAYNNKKYFVPYNVCPIEVRYAIQCLEPCTQIYHHDYETVWARMNNNIYTNQYESFFKEMAYNAFFITMKWYYRFMKNEQSNPSKGQFTDREKLYYK